MVMTPENFLMLNYFTQSEVESTGANIKDVKFELMFRLDAFRRDLGAPVYLLKKGLTTGGHSSPEHPAGKAVDVYISEVKPVWTVYKCALKNQFRGFGVYWNGIAYSYHLDIGAEYRQWVGVPDGKGNWRFGSLIVDPKNLI